MLPTKEDLTKRYAAYSDEKLFEVLYNKNDYTSDALDAARDVLASRNITMDQVHAFVEVTKETEEIQKVEEKILSYIPLSFGEKLLFFVFWFLPFFIGTAIRLNYAEDGLVLKLKQSKVFAIAGFVNVFATFLIAEFLNLSEVGGYLVFFLLPVIFFAVEKRVVYNVEKRD
jgi:hypothetical protein